VRRQRDRRADAVLTEVSPEGRLAGRIFAVTLIVSAVAMIVVLWDDIWRVCGEVVGPCIARSAGAMILAMCSLAAIGWGAGILLRLRRRPVDPEGSARFVWALGVLVALGGIFIAGRIPAYTCAQGRFDDVLVMCLHPPSTSDATSWLLLKKAIVVVSLIVAVLVSVRPRNVKVTAPLSVGVWAVGFGWLLADTMA
jgi:hypothetical protein